LTFDLLTSKFIGVIYWPWPIFLQNTMTATHKLFKILSGHVFCIKCYCDFDLVTSKFIGVIYWVWPIFLLSRMSLINFSKYWVDTFFLLNATVTLTFDLLTSKFIGVIYWPWPIFLQNTMTATHKLFKILSEHGFCIKCYCDFDLVTSKFIGVIYWVWPIFLLSRMNVTHKLFKILSGHSFCIKCFCDLDLWPSDLKIYRGHLLTMNNLLTKYHDCHSETSQEIGRTWCG